MKIKRKILCDEKNITWDKKTKKNQYTVRFSTRLSKTNEWFSHLVIEADTFDQFEVGREYRVEIYDT